MGELLDGRLLADKIQGDLAKEVASFDKAPGLIVLIVGENPASKVYVRNKEKSCAKIGIRSKVERLPEETTEAELLAIIAYYNEHPDFQGILVQLPLPKHINEETIVSALHPEKDVDGFNPQNIGHLFVGKKGKIPCTPYGIMRMLQAYEIELAGKQALIVGRSNIVGKPLAHLLLKEDATVTIAHSKTKNLQHLTKQADILIVAIGKGHFITADFVKPGAVVVDVGMNHAEDGHLIGDVDTESVRQVASYITPVPGGVGPMTITMLMEQTVDNLRGEN